MTATPAALLTAGKAIPRQAGEPVHELLEETRIRMDGQGRRTTRYRYVFRVDEASAIESWASITAEWSPWYEARPVVEARVVTPDGAAHRMDPSTLGEYGADDADASVYGDRKYLRGPLPRLQVGAIAEVCITYTETEPFSRAGTRGRIPLDQSVPVHQTLVELEAPSGGALATRLIGMPGALLRRTEGDGVVRVTLEVGPQPSRASREPNLPPEVAPLPCLHYSTAKGWGPVASEYAAIVERQLDGANLSAWVRETAGAASGRPEKISRIVARLHREVRYTGVEFRDAAIVPARPEETLKRGYGDCKDKATLLVGLLREAGIPAEVALLRAGTGLDVEPMAPGLSSFNHAIVHLPGEAPLWIDATADLDEPGALLQGVEGRWALIASPGTKALVRVPEISPAANRYRETRVVTFREGGAGDLRETTLAEGWWAGRYRQDYSRRDDKKLRENLEGYAKGTFSAKGLGTFKHSDPRGLGAPFELSLEILETPQVRMDATHAVVSVNPWSLVTKLQRVLKDGLGEGSEPTKKRQGDLLLPEPYQHHLTYEINLPVGFAPSTLPKGREVDFGPARLTMDFRADQEGKVLASCVLDTRKRRWSAAEVNQALEAIHAFGEEKIAQVVLEQVGERLLSEGRIKEAITEFRRLAEAQPGVASPHARIARAYLAAGLGEAARVEARKAVALEPGSATAQETLGWVLQHDQLGRRFQWNWDLTGSLAAYRRAKELDGKRYSIRGDLAILLEHDAQGRRYGRGADLEGAIAEYRALQVDLKNHALDMNLLLCLAKKGRYQEALELAKGMPAAAGRDSWLVVCLVRLRGVEDAIRESSLILTDLSARRTAWLNSADHLLNLRMYPEASRILMEASNGSEQMSQIRGRAELIARVRRIEPDGAPFDTPGALARQFLLAMLRQESEPKALRAFFTPSVGAYLTDEGLSQMAQTARQILKGVDLAPEALADVTVSLAQVAADGDDRIGYRVEVRGFGGEPQVLEVTRASGTYRLIGAGQDQSLLSVEILRQIEQGRLEEAGAWLDRIRDRLQAPPADDAVAGPVLTRFWTRGQARTPEAMRLAASVLVPKELIKSVRSDLIKLRRSHVDGPRALDLDAALMFMALQEEDWAAALEHAAKLRTAYPDSETLAYAVGAALMGNKQWTEAEAHFARARASHPQNLAYLEGHFQVLRETGRREQLDREMADRVAKGAANRMIFNNLAWSDVVRGRVSEKTLELIRSGTQGNEQDSASLHTLAAILAELGRTREAKDALVKELSVQDKGELGGNEWYVLGRIAEQLGAPEMSVGCYERVLTLATRKEKDDPDSCASLASRRLKDLKPS